MLFLVVALPCAKAAIVDPLFAFAFIQTFVDILQDYFGTLSAAALRDNFDVVYQAGLFRFDNRPSCLTSHSYLKKP